MAFNIQRWAVISGSSNNRVVTLQGGMVVGAPNVFTYISGTDTTGQIEAANYFGEVVVDLSVGDIIYAVGTDGSALLTVITVDVYLKAVTTAVQVQSGDVDGPNSSVNNDFALFSGTTGKVIKDAGYSIVPGSAGGTGVNNGSFTWTTGGNVFFGGFNFSAILTGNTAVTFPTTGTLATTSQIPTLPLSGANGGTGIANTGLTITLGGSLATVGAFNSTFTMTNTTSVTFPTSGTLATTSQIPTGAALTEVNDTNVTLTLGGSPNTALVNAASITAGWSGQLATTRGGTNLASFTSNGVFYASSSSVMAQVTPANNSVLVTNGSGVPSLSTTLPSFTTGTITFSPTTGGLVGTTAADNAAAGNVGQFISSVIASGSAVSLTNNTAANVTSISLTAGDWDVWGNVSFLPNGSSVTGSCFGWTNTTSATAPDLSLYASINDAASTSITAFSVPQLRYNVSTTTTVYLSVLCGFTGVGAAVTACGGIYARRRR